MDRDIVNQCIADQEHKLDTRLVGPVDDRLMLPVVVLIATRPTIDYLLQMSLPSIRSQLHQPDLVVIVADSQPLNTEEQQLISQLLAPVPALFLNNQRIMGAAGSWNTGIDCLSAKYQDAYVAILDDDDRWNADHLALCVIHAHAINAEIVVSGIEVRNHLQLLDTKRPRDLAASDFLVSNPGWQGSNTFIRLSVLNEVGGYTDGLVSSNDRDLAIRVLAGQPRQIAYTGVPTVTWFCNQSGNALSAPTSAQKRKGCAQFLMIHGHRMSKSVQKQYFLHMETRFNVSRSDIQNEIKLLGASLESISRQGT